MNVHSADRRTAALRFVILLEEGLSWHNAGAPARCTALCRDNPAMAQGKRISSDIGSDALKCIKDMGAAAKRGRTEAGEGQAAAAARLGVHVQTIARIESGEPGVAVGHVLGMLALYGVSVRVASSDGPPST